MMGLQIQRLSGTQPGRPGRTTTHREARPLESILFTQIINRHTLQTARGARRTNLINQGTVRLRDHLYTQRFSSRYHRAGDGFEPEMLQVCVRRFDFRDFVNML
jgi:hypothetical protein